MFELICFIWRAHINTVLLNPHSTPQTLWIKFEINITSLYPMSWKLPSLRPERLYKEPLLTPAFPAALSEIIKPLGPGVSPTPQTRGFPFTADNGHKNQISILHLHNWAAYEKAKKSRLSTAAARLDDKHCRNHHTLPVMLHWFTLRSLTETIIPVALLLGSAWLGSARPRWLTVVWQLLRPKNHSVQVTSRRLIPRTVPAFTRSGLLTNHQQKMSTWKSEAL